MAESVSTAHTELAGPGFVYASQELRFLGPVFVGDTITVQVTVVDKRPAKRILIMDTIVRKQTGQAVLRGLSAEGDVPCMTAHGPCVDEGRERTPRGRR